MAPARQVAVLIFDDVELLDFAAPIEVLSVAGRRSDLDLFNVFTVGPCKRVIQTRNRLRVVPSCTIRQRREADVLVIPGGFGTREQIKRKSTIDWVRRMAAKSEAVLSVCTGSLLLASAGLLRGLPATTHRNALDLLAELEPECTVVSQRVVDTGKIVTTAGVSAGIDGALHLLERLTSPEIAIECAEYIEYDWQRDRLLETVS